MTQYGLMQYSTFFQTHLATSGVPGLSGAHVNAAMPSAAFSADSGCESTAAQDTILPHKPPAFPTPENVYALLRRSAITAVE